MCDFNDGEILADRLHEIMEYHVGEQSKEEVFVKPKKWNRRRKSDGGMFSGEGLAWDS